MAVRTLFSRRWLLLTLALLLAGLAVLPLRLTRPENINESAFSRIELGMTREQVQIILNQVVPDVEWRTRSRCWLVYSEDSPDRIPPSATVWVELDEATNKTVDKGYIPQNAPAIWTHFVNRLNTTFGRDPPYPSSPQFFPSGLLDP